VVRSIDAAWERGDFSSAGWAHPEIESAFADGHEPGCWTRMAGMAEAMRNMPSAWQDVRAEADEFASSTASACSRLITAVRVENERTGNRADTDRGGLPDQRSISMIDSASGPFLRWWCA
jgi:hypothetical protein